MAPTPVELLLKGDRAEFKKCIDVLAEYLDTPPRKAALRLALLGLAEHIKGTGLHKVYDTLFPSDRQIGFNEHTITRFVKEKHKERVKDLPAHLALLVTHHVHTLTDPPQTGTLALALAANDAIKMVSAYVQHRSRDELFPKPNYLATDQLVAMFRRQLGFGDDDHMVARVFFRPTGELGAEPIKDASYYAVYRYSRSRKSIIKTFASIMSPLYAPYGCYSFTHIYQRAQLDPKAEPSASKRSDQKLRITRGGIVSFDRTVYLIGLSGTEQTPGKLTPKGLKAIAIPHDGLNNDHRCVAGLFLSNAQNWEPLAGRCMLLHLGYHSLIGPQTHKTARIGLIKSDGDLLEDITRMCSEFNGHDSTTDPQSYCDRVLRGIDNCPADEREADIAKDGIPRAITIDSDD